MMYQGGKTRLAAAIADLIKAHAAPGATYVEPFLGSAAVMCRVAPHFERAVGADLVPDLVALWAAARDGWVPPEELTVEEYDALRDALPSALRAFAGFPCSFGGKWFGGYARDPKSDRNFARAASRSIVRRAAALQGVELRCADYRALSDVIGPGTVVYADTPYAGTTGYSGAGAFDSAEFWRTADGWADLGATVLVSEYAAPDRWEAIWETSRHVSTALDNRRATAVDRVFSRP